MANKKLIKSTKLVGGSKRKPSKPTTTVNKPRIVKDTRPRNEAGEARLENGLVEFISGERSSEVIWEDPMGRIYYYEGGRTLRKVYLSERYTGRVFMTAGDKSRIVYYPLRSSQKLYIYMNGVQRQLRRLPSGTNVYYKCYRADVYGENKIPIGGTLKFPQAVRNLAGETFEKHPYEMFIVEAEVR